MASNLKSRKVSKSAYSTTGCLGQQQCPQKSTRLALWGQVARCARFSSGRTPKGETTPGWDQKVLVDSFASNYKCHASSNKCLTSSNKKAIIIKLTTSFLLSTTFQNSAWIYNFLDQESRRFTRLTHCCPAGLHRFGKPAAWLL